MRAREALKLSKKRGGMAYDDAAAWDGKLTFIMRHVILIYHPYAACTRTKAIATQTTNAYSNSDLDTKSVWSCPWERVLIRQGVGSTPPRNSFHSPTLACGQLVTLARPEVLPPASLSSTSFTQLATTCRPRLSSPSLGLFRAFDLYLNAY